MTNREPDDLYDALRDRLTDYGQEPPAPLWAGIRAQLPPPVAQPRLRPKRRAAVVLLLLLLVTASGLGWRWWHGQPLNDRTAGPQLAAVKSTSSAVRGQDINQTQISTPAASTAPLSNVPSAPLHPGPTVRGTDNAAAPAGTNRQPEATKTTEPIGSQPAINEATSAVASTTAGVKPKVAAAIAARVHGTEPTAARPPKRRLQDAATITISGKTVTRITQTPKPDQYSAGREIAVNTAKNSGVASAPAAVGSGLKTRKAAFRRSYAATIAANPATRQSTHRRPSSGLEATGIVGRSTATALQPTTTILRPTTLQPTGEARTESLAGAADSTSPVVDGTDLPAAQSPGRLQSRAVALELAAGPGLPQPQAASTTPIKPSAIALPRWAVQVLAGPALSYRHLSSSGLLYASAPNPNPVQSQYQYNSADIAKLERPALSGGAQVNVRRALTERWNLSAGLGYAEYATRLALQQIQVTRLYNTGTMAPMPDSSTTSIHRRDTYRFVTVPLRVGYTRALSSRWSMGLLAGADVAFYIGGSSTEGSACTCQTQSWGLTGSPYRRVSVGASLGVEMRYRLNGRWELLAQPTATYMLNQLAQPNAAYGQRHLLGGTAWLGAAYTLP